jgi:hypothetical protein
LPGLQRFKAAQDWIDARTAKSGGTPEEAKFRKFIDGVDNRTVQQSSEDTAKLYNEFLKWKREKDLQR